MSNKDWPWTRTALAALLLWSTESVAVTDATSTALTAAASPRLYVLDCVAIHVADTARYELRRDEVETSDLSVACFLDIHPKGALIWDAGAVPDSEWQPTGASIVHALCLPDGQTRDNSVVIKFAPGHTPGHQTLLVRLKHTGPVLLSGDLYHFAQERTLNRFPVFEFDKDQTRRTRLEIEDFLKATGASLWIQHDFIANRDLRKSPAFYD